MKISELLAIMQKDYRPTDSVQASMLINKAIQEYIDEYSRREFEILLQAQKNLHSCKE